MIEDDDDGDGDSGIDHHQDLHQNCESLQTSLCDGDDGDDGRNGASDDDGHEADGRPPHFQGCCDDAFGAAQEMDGVMSGVYGVEEEEG